MKILELRKKLKEKVGNLYVINGNDDFLILQAQNILEEMLVDGAKEFNLVKVNASEYKEGDYKLLLSTLPFGSSYRLVFIENINNVGISELQKFSKLDPYGVVVIVLRGSEKIGGEYVNCDHLDALDLKKRMTNFLSSKNLKIDKSAMDLAIAYANSDLMFLNTELNKVASYMDENGTITDEIINLMFTKNENFWTYNLTSAIDEKNIKKAMEILNGLNENNSFSDIFTFMGPYFRKMFYCAINSNDQNLANILKTKPYAIQKSREFVIKNGKGFYIKKYSDYLALDYEIKSGKISPRNAIYSLLI